MSEPGLSAAVAALAGRLAAELERLPGLSDDSRAFLRRTGRLWPVRTSLSGRLPLVLIAALAVFAIAHEALCLCAEVAKTIAQRRRQSGFDVAGDEADGVQILQVHAIAEPEARQLHPDKIGDGHQKNTFCRRHRRGEARHRFGVLRSHLFPDEHEMNRAPGARFARIDQHIDAGRVPIFEANRTDRIDDCVKIASINRDVDVACRTRGEWIALIHVQEHGDAAHDPILNTRLGERASEAIDSVKQLLHMAIVRGNGGHGSHSDYGMWMANLAAAPGDSGSAVVLPSVRLKA